MDIAIVGTGYVGLVTGACFASSHQVTCVDKDAEKIAALRRGASPIYEPGLEALLRDNAGRLSFTTEIAEALEHAEVVFIAVGTPSAADSDGVDLSAVRAVAEEIGKHLCRSTVVVNKSTVPVGTGRAVEQLIGRHARFPFAVASNPEFLKEGHAIEDFRRPDRVVIGIDTSRSSPIVSAVRERLVELYRPFVRDLGQILIVSRESAELIKYASNAMLATRISFMNEIANLCEKVGADIDEVRRGVGSDHRIGPEFLYAGSGYSGSCFPKDCKALQHLGRSRDVHLSVVEAAIAANDRQRHVVFEKLKAAFNGTLGGRRIVIWGLAFKPGTDDTRESVAYTLAEELVAAGAVVVAYDPVVTVPPADTVLADDPYGPLSGADAVVLMTEWPELRAPDWRRMYTLMSGGGVGGEPRPVPRAVDGKNAWNAAAARAAGYVYCGIGRRTED